MTSGGWKTYFVPLLTTKVIEVSKRFMGDTLATAYEDPRLTLVSDEAQMMMMKVVIVVVPRSTFSFEPFLASRSI